MLFLVKKDIQNHNACKNSNSQSLLYYSSGERYASSGIKSAVLQLIGLKCQLSYKIYLISCISNPIIRINAFAKNLNLSIS